MLFSSRMIFAGLVAAAVHFHASAVTTLTFGNGSADFELLPNTPGQTVDLFLSASPSQVTSAANLQFSVGPGGPAVGFSSPLSETIYAGGALLSDTNLSPLGLNVGLLAPFPGFSTIDASGSQKLGTLSFDTTNISAGTFSLDFSSTSLLDATGAPINFSLAGGASVSVPTPPILGGTRIGIDFGVNTPTNTPGNDWNESNGTTLIPTGSVIDLDGNLVSNVSVSFSVAQFNNNDGSDADYAAALPGTPGIDPYFVESVVTDIAGVFSSGNNPYVVTFSGLDNSKAYNVIAVSAAEFAENGSEDLTINGQTSSINRGTIANPTFHRFEELTAANGVLELTFTQNGGAASNPIVNGILLEAIAAFAPADLDQDGDVDDADFGLFFAAFSGPGVPTGNPAADLDGDTDTDDADFGLAFAAFTGPGGPANVPEPTSLVLLGIGGLALRRRRHASRSRRDTGDNINACKTVARREADRESLD